MGLFVKINPDFPMTLDDDIEKVMKARRHKEDVRVLKELKKHHSQSAKDTGRKT